MINQQYYQQLRQQYPDVALVAVSKKHPADAIRQLYHLGQRAFAENYVQEAEQKLAELSALTIDWHFIGKVQSNKTKTIAALFSWVQSIDRLSIAKRLAHHRPMHLPPLNVLVQVNLDHEATKAGVAVTQALSLADQVAKLDNLTLRGFMTIPKPQENPEQQVLQYQIMSKLFQQAKTAGLTVDTLSMGMSQDYHQAIRAGSNMIRIGQAIFGERR